jgi:nucleotide-binding universal stress UspA family protein
MRTVLVAIDQSDTAERVVEFVNEFFDHDRVDVVGINVAPTPSPWVPPAMGWGGLYSWGNVNRFGDEQRELELQREAEARARDAVRTSGLRDADAIGEVGDPVHAIERAAEHLDVDVIVVGSDDRGFIDRMFTRSVSKDIVANAGRPVLVVR